MRNISIFSLVLILATCIISPLFSQQQETITITTYYPAPFGVYQNLRLFPTTAEPACNEGNEGVMYYDNTINQLRVCRQTGTMPDTFGWQIAGSLWTLGGISPNQFIYPSDTNWNVGIGIAQPVNRLHVFAPTLADPNGPAQVGIADGLGRWDIWAGANFHIIENNGPGVDNYERTRIYIEGATDNVGIGTTNPQTKLHISGTAGTDGIIYPDGTKQTSAKLSCVTNTNGWGPIVNGQTYSVACPADYVGVHGRFEYYDTNSVVGGGGGTLKYHGLSPCTWNAARTTCSVTPNDAGISEGQVFVDCCRIP